jgi:hypothetical protein
VKTVVTGRSNDGECEGHHKTLRTHCLRSAALGEEVFAYYYAIIKAIPYKNGVYKLIWEMRVYGP